MLKIYVFKYIHRSSLLFIPSRHPPPPLCKGNVNMLFKIQMLSGGFPDVGSSIDFPPPPLISSASSSKVLNNHYSSLSAHWDSSVGSKLPQKCFNFAWALSWGLGSITHCWRPRSLERACKSSEPEIKSAQISFVKSQLQLYVKHEPLAECFPAPWKKKKIIKKIFSQSHVPQTKEGKIGLWPKSWNCSCSCFPTWIASLPRAPCE